MAKKDKLYKVNKWNMPLFAQGVDREHNNIFDGALSSNINRPLADRLASNEYGSLYGDKGYTMNDYLDSKNWLGLSKRDNLFSKYNIQDTGLKLKNTLTGGNALNALADPIGEALHRSISGGLTSNAGNILKGAGDIMSKVLPGKFGIVGKIGFDVLSGGVNKLIGTKVNQEKLNAANQGTNALNSFKSDADEFADIQGPEAVANVQDAYSGGVFKKHSAKEKNEALKRERANALAFANRSIENNVDNIIEDKVNDALANFASYGGPLDMIGFNNGAIGYDFMSDYLMTKNRVADNKNNVSTNYFSNFSNPFAIGGDLQTQGADWSTGLTHIDAGGTHEENPNEGVQVGVDNEGVPNLVEEGETIFNDYVFSDRIKMDDAAKERFHISKKKDYSFAEYSKKLEKLAGERMDAITRNGLKKQLAILEEEQERQREELKAQEAQEAFAQLPVEQQQALLQQAAMQEQQAVAQESMPTEEQMIAEQQMQEQAVPQEEVMMQEEIPVEQMAEGGNLFKDGGDKSAIKDVAKATVGKFNNAWNTANSQRENSATSNKARALNWINNHYSRLSTQAKEDLADYLQGYASDNDYRNAINRMNYASFNHRTTYKELRNYKNTTYKNPNNGKVFNSKDAALVDMGKKSSNYILNGNNDFQLGEHPTVNTPFTPKPVEQNTPKKTKTTTAKYKTTGKVEYTTPQPKKESDFSILAASSTPGGNQSTVTNYSNVTNTPVKPTVYTAQTTTSTPSATTANQKTKSTAKPVANTTSRTTSKPAKRTATVTNDGIIPYDYYTNGSDGISTPMGFKVGDNGSAYDYTDNYRTLVDVLTADDIREWAKNNPNDLSLASFINNGNSLDKLTDKQWREGALDGKYGFMHHVADQLLREFEPSDDNVDNTSVDNTSVANATGTVAADADRFVTPDPSTVQEKANPFEAEWTKYGTPTPANTTNTISAVNNTNTNSTNGNTNRVAPNLLSTWQRGAGAAGPLVTLGMQALGVGKPNNSGLYSALNLATTPPALYQPRYIGNYMRFKPYDLLFQVNQAVALSNATDRAILNSAMPQASKNASLLANSYNNQIANGELYRKALEYNDAGEKAVQEFNRETDLSKVEAYNKAAMTNTENRNRANMNNAQMALNVASRVQDNDASWFNGIYGNINNYFKNLGLIGKENESHNMIARMAADGLFGPMRNQYIADGYLTEENMSAKGGKLKKKKSPRKGLTF